MQIDLKTLKAEMKKHGYDHTRKDTLTGVAEEWTNTMVDALESLYSLETELLKEFDK